MDNHDEPWQLDLGEKLRRFGETCRKHRLRITPQRSAIYRELISSGTHPSAMAIYKQVKTYFPNISLATVSNTLLTFDRMGLARAVEFSGDPKRFDSNLRPHHHFRCVDCGRVIDFCSDEYDRLELPADIKRRFIIFDKRVHLDGRCDNCEAKVGR